MRTDEESELIVNAHTVQCNPGFDDATEEGPYSRHCTEEASPTVIFLGSVVGPSHGRLINDSPTLLM